MKKIMLFAVIFALGLFSVLAACGGSSGSTAQKYTVSMSGTTFNSNSITISKGSTITFMTEQGGTAHNLVIGTNGHANAESGTPDFGSGGQTVGPGQSWTSGPWNTAGTFHVTCTYHPTTMTLTVTVNG